MRIGQGAFGLGLREARVQAGLSQVQLAELAGVSRRTIIRWESEEVSPWVPELKTVIDVLRLGRSDIEELTSGLASSRGRREFHPNRMKLVARWLGVARRRAGLSLRDVAAVFNNDPSTVRRWESGRLSPSPEQMGRLFEVLDVSQAERNEVEGKDPHAEAWASGAGLETALKAVLDPWDREAYRCCDIRFLKLLESPSIRADPRWTARTEGAYAWMLSTCGRYGEGGAWAAQARRPYESGRLPADRTFLSTAITLARCQGCAANLRRGRVAPRVLDDLEGRPLDWVLLAHRFDAYGEIYAFRGDFKRALSFSDRAVEAAQRHGVKTSRLFAYNRARILMHSGEPGLALEAVPGFSDTTPLHNGLEAHTLGEIHTRLGRAREAGHWFSVAERIGREYGLGRAISSARWIVPSFEG